MIINDVPFNSDLSEILQELKSQLELNHIQLLQKTRDSGDDIMVQCPYHGNGQEKKPSAGIKKQTGVFHCFACNEVHTLPEVISYCFGHYEDAFGKFGWQWLNKNFTSVAVEQRKDIELNLTRNAQKQEVATAYVTEEELDGYRYTHPYWAKRGITDSYIIELFDLGYDKKTDCITFPVRDRDGHTLFVARRSVKSKFFSYPKGVEKPLYGLYEILIEQHNYRTVNCEPYFEAIVVCESMIDALTVWQCGGYAVAMNGLGTELQFQQLRDLPCRKLILATDNDKAGLEARKRIQQNVKNKLITEYILPEGKKDINELTLEEYEQLEEIF